MNLIDKMIKWFGGGDGDVPPVNTQVVEELKPKDISEPILTLVELMKKDFKRFHAKEETSSRRTIITLKDIKTGMCLELGASWGFGLDIQVISPEWFTKDEADLIYTTFEKIRWDRQIRINKIRQWQNKRKRQKWVDVYCKEETA